MGRAGESAADAFPLQARPYRFDDLKPRSPLPSFPRKRESRATGEASHELPWIPAFAGMTAEKLVPCDRPARPCSAERRRKRQKIPLWVCPSSSLSQAGRFRTRMGQYAGGRPQANGRLSPQPRWPQRNLLPRTSGQDQTVHNHQRLREPRPEHAMPQSSIQGDPI